MTHPEPPRSKEKWTTRSIEPNGQHMAFARTATICVVTGLLLIGCHERPDPTVRETPVTILKEVEGYGRPVSEGDRVTIAYRLILPDGSDLQQFDGFKFELGAGSVIDGVNDAVLGMKLRGKRSVAVPPHKHWGRAGYGNGAVPPNTMLRLEVELVAVN